MLRLLCSLLAFGVGAAGTGCSEEIGEAPERAAYFTLWGTLDPTTSHQALRVIPVLPQIDAETAQALGATVTTTDLASGQTYHWRDSTVVFASGRVGHVFHTAQAIGYGRSQLVRVTRDDGATTSAYVRMPPDVPPILETSVLDRFPLGMVLEQPVFWPGAPRLKLAYVHYYLRDNVSCTYFSFDAPGTDGAVQVEPTGAGWRTTWSFARARARSFSNLRHSFSILQTTLVAEIAMPEAMPPDGVFDPDLYFDPGSFTNVDQGFGLVSGSYRRAISWTTPEGPCPGGASP